VNLNTFFLVLYMMSSVSALAGVMSTKSTEGFHPGAHQLHRGSEVQQNNCLAPSVPLWICLLLLESSFLLALSDQHASWHTMAP